MRDVVKKSDPLSSSTVGTLEALSGLVLLRKLPNYNDDDEYEIYLPPILFFHLRPLWFPTPFLLCCLAPDRNNIDSLVSYTHYAIHRLFRRM